MPLSISSAAFSQGQQIPSRYCKDSANVSPPFAWRGVPAATRSFALMMESADVSKDPFRHWAAYDIPADARHLDEGAGSAPHSVRLRSAVNDFGRRRYDGPHPPSGRSLHHYRFRLLALDVSRLKLRTGATAAEVAKAAKSHTIASAETTGTFKHSSNWTPAISNAQQLVTRGAGSKP
jgi:Raf kinase inhibitor-like YbhB/YbcL family protein